MMSSYHLLLVSALVVMAEPVPGYPREQRFKDGPTWGAVGSKVL
jgi:hypothetical protein